MKAESKRYAKWGFGLCLLLFVFCLVMIWVGIKPLSLGQAATAGCLGAAVLVLGYVAFLKK